MRFSIWIIHHIKNLSLSTIKSNELNYRFILFHYNIISTDFHKILFWITISNICYIVSILASISIEFQIQSEKVHIDLCKSKLFFKSWTIDFFFKEIEPKQKRLTVEIYFSNDLVVEYALHTLWILLFFS
jgi:hypothetical protein